VPGTIIVLDRVTSLDVLQNFLPKLKAHLLPRITSQLRDERTSRAHEVIPDEHQSAGNEALDNNTAGIFFKHDRLYAHQIMRINYTTYDVRRAQDTINPRTSHCDVMVLADDEVENANHPFLYARVIRIFHVNVVYTGPGMLDYRPRKFNVLWVRWFERASTTCGWMSRSLDCLHFPAMSSEYAFGFLDPAQVLRGCQIIPGFSKGPRYADGRGLSECARDQHDWRSYYTNR
jgi:hypothetical protein